MDHKLTRTGYKKGGTTPSLLGHLGGYHLSPRVLTKEWKLWGGVTAAWADAVASRLH